MQTRKQVKGGFRSPELLLLQRALGMYCHSYQLQMGSAVTAHEKAECMSYIKAAEAISKRLRYELETITIEE